MILIVAGLTIGQLSFTAAQDSLKADAGPDQTVQGPSPVKVQFHGTANVDEVMCHWFNQWGALRAAGDCNPVIEVNFGKNAKPGTTRTFLLDVARLDGTAASAYDRVTITLGRSQAAPPPTPQCPEPTATASASSAYPGETVTVSGDGWIPGGEVLLSLDDEGIHIPLTGVNSVPDSGSWETTFMVPDEPWGYWLTAAEEHEGCDLYVQSTFEIKEPPGEEGDPLKSATFSSLTTHSYEEVGASEAQYIDIGFLDGDRFYIRSNSTRITPAAVECHSGLAQHWSADQGGGSTEGSTIEGCIGDRDFFDSGVIGVSPNYDGNVITGWDVWSGEETLARITPAPGRSYGFITAYTLVGQD